MLRILELAWLVIAILAAIIAVYQSKVLGLENSWYFFIFTFVAAVMYTIRRRQRIKHEKSNKE